MFLSIFAATCRPYNIIGFLDNLAQTADDPGSFEVLLKLDEGATDLITLIEDYKKTAQFSIKYLETPILDGYYSLDVGYNELLKIADKNTYFCWLLTDEIRFEKKGWDTILKKYIGFYPDNIFRIKLSIFQLKNYNDFFECLPAPDNYAVTTRQWLEMTGGWGHFWGPDSWHQCIDYFLGLCKNKDNPYGTWRSFPIFDIAIKGQEAGQGITDPLKEKQRAARIHAGWNKHSTHKAQEHFYRLALRLNAHIIAVANNLDRYILEENIHKKTTTLFDLEKNSYARSSYKLPSLKIKFLIGVKKFTLMLASFPHLYRIAKKINEGYETLISFYGSLKRSVRLATIRFAKFIFSILRIKIKKSLKKEILYFYDGKNLTKIDRTEQLEQ
jgi:hypothetical protein